jgi:hypothetical protein
MTATKSTCIPRRIDRLKAISLERGFTNEDAKPFGKLSKTSTWEALLRPYLADSESLDTPLDTVDATPEPLDLTSVDSVDTPNWTNNGSFPAYGITRQNSTNFLDWVDFSQLIALVLASAVAFVLAMSAWRQIGPNLFPPVRITIQIGQK